jgi:opacity protein-like surface antigen
MKKIRILCVLFVLLTPLLITAQDQEETLQAQKARVIVDKAPIYLESNPYSFIIDTVSRETIVTLFQTGKKNKKWLYISYYSKKRMAQVTGFIDINLVEILSEKPKNPELSEEIEGKSVTIKQDELAVQSEAEKESSDPQKELAALENILKESEEESGEETEERNQTRSEKEAGIKKESEEKQEEQKEIPVQANPLTESVQQEKGSVEEEQKVETAVEQETAEEVQVKTEEEEEAEEENKTEEKSMEAVKKLEGQDEEMKAQTEEEEKNREAENLEEHKKQPIEENYQEVLTKITIKVRKANIRLMPSLKSAVIHQLPFGVELEPLAKSGDWYRVNLPPNRDGFILSGYIHDSIVNETFEKQVLAPPEPEEPLESMLEIPEEEPEPAPEPSQEIRPAGRTGKTLPSFWIGGGAGYAMPSESNFDKSINYGGTLGLGITRYLALELRVPYYKSHVTGTLGGLSTGQFQAISFTLSVQARYPIKNLIIPYLVVGGDYHLNKFTLDNEIVNSWNAMGFDIEESVEHSFGFHFGGGIDFFIMRSLALNLDVRYYTASMKGDWRLADTISQVESTGPIDNIKLNSIQAAISVKFFLNR